MQKWFWRNPCAADWALPDFGNPWKTGLRLQFTWYERINQFSIPNLFLHEKNNFLPRHRAAVLLIGSCTN
jgi:hypothetical protein